jgi:tetratricopeptide (TPR) repeat protein
MTRKKADKQEQTESQEITGTLTDLGYEASDADSEAVLKKLLGSRGLKTASAPRVLLMPEKASSRGDLMRSEKVEASKISDRAICVLGPFDPEQLKKKALDGLLRRGDRVIFAGNRWKPVLEEFPEWSAHVSGHDEFSRTMELTQTETLTTESGDGIEDIEEQSISRPGAYELEDVDEGKPKTNEAGVDSAPASAAPAPKKTNAESKAPPRLPELEKVEAVPANKSPETRPSASPIGKGLGPIQLTLAISAVIVVGAIVFSIKPEKKKPESEALFPTNVIENKVKSSMEWPANLRPRVPDSLYADENPMLKKIRPVLRAYEAGVTQLNQSDELLLRRYSDPASANWDVRKLASNQLAVAMMVRSDLERARALLLPILQADAGDFATLVNLSLLDIWEGRLPSAREALRVASRLNGDMRWLTLSLLGTVEGHADRWPASTASFEDALKAQPNNPYVQGLWMQILLKKNKGARFQLQKLVGDALWGDPDSLIDSPVPAPIASHLIHLEALDGLLRGAESLGVPTLSAGQLAYVRWLKGRATGFSTSTPSLAQVSAGLESEEDLHSQVLYAYALKEQGRYDEAAQVLSKVLPLIEARKLTNSSWPWTLAGDVEVARLRFDQAILFYQGALNRNNLDVAAVYGLAMTLRERGQYVEAEQKLREALALQPSFMPARLRISRLEWQGLARSQ